MITLAAITLRNWLRSECLLGKIYIPFGLVDRKNIDTVEVLRDLGDLNPLPPPSIFFQILVTEFVQVTRL